MILSSSDNDGVDFHVVIPCAGSGSRFKNSMPKQYALIDEHTILWHTLNAILRVPVIKSIWVVANPDDSLADEYRALSPKIHIIKVGANTRAKSVLNGLLELHGRVNANDWVLVHDAARCCIKPELIIRLINALKGDMVGGILALPATDTVKQIASTASNQKVIVNTLDRSQIYLAQTPQMFRYDILRQALINADLQLITDEASAVELTQHTVKIIEGDAANIKVTYPRDIMLARLFLKDTLKFGDENNPCSIK